MKKTDKSIDDYRDENARLKKDINELNNIIETIRSGKVDAIIGNRNDGGYDIHTIERNNQPYNNLIDNMSLGICTLDMDGKILYANKELCHILDVAQNKVRNISFYDFIPEFQHDSLIRIVTIGATTNISAKFKIRTTSQLCRYVLIKSQIFKMAGVNGVTLVVENITDIENAKLLLKKDELKLDESETIFREFAENIDDVLWRSDIKMNSIIYVSPSFENVWCQPISRLYETPHIWLDSIFPEDKETVLRSLDLIKSGKIDSLKLEYRVTISPLVTKFIVTTVRLVNKNINPVIIFISADVSESKNTNKNLIIQNEISSALVSKDEIEEKFNEILKILCKYFEWDVGQLWMLDNDGRNLKRLVSFSQDKNMSDYFNSEIGVITNIHKNAIAMQTFLNENQQAIPDLLTEPEFYHKKMLISQGCRSVFVSAIKYDNKMLGSIILYCKKQHKADDSFLYLFNSVKSLIGVELRLSVDKLNLKKSLLEKNALLKELYHRVKNNLQVISSLIQMESRKIENSSLKNSFLETAARVRSMSLVHEMLYQSESLVEINISKYITRLSEYLYESYNVSSKKMKLTIKSGDVFVPIAIAVPCGLIINELITNSIKHAFSENRIGNINITINQCEKNLIVSVRDDGLGLPDKIDIEKSESLGMKLIYALTKQLSATITFVSDGGLCTTLTIPLKVD